MYTRDEREREKRQMEEWQKQRQIEEQKKREKREIYSRLNQFFDKIASFEHRYNFIQYRLTEVVELQNQFKQLQTKNESTLDNKFTNEKLESQQCNSLIIELEQKFNNQLKLREEFNIKQLKQIEEQDKIWKDKIEIDIQNLLKLISENQQFEKQGNQQNLIQSQSDLNTQLKEIISQIKQKEEQHNGWKEKIEMDFQNLQKQINENQQQNQCPTNQQNLIKPKPDSIEKNGDIIKNIIEDIYSKTTRRRSVSGQYQYFVHQLSNQSDLAKNYNLKLEQKKTINQYIQGFRQVRGDGNCFYTSFGFEYLQLLIVHYDQNQYDEFLNLVIKKMRFRIEYQSTKIDDEKIETQLREEFIKRINFIRNQENKEMRQDELFKQFRAHEQEEDKQVDGYFYALSTIFFRNLSLHFIEQSEYKDNFPEKETLLLWEVECNSNEIVISILAQQLKINIVVFLFDTDKFTMMEYNKEAKRKIILLLQPGHYNIGVQKIEE